jgi:hypothetical protein
MSQSQFVDHLVSVAPEAAAMVDEHLADYDELLLHPLMADFRRLAVAAYGRGDVDVSQRCLDLADRALLEGDPDVVNAVAVSFVEEIGADPGESPAFLATWPVGLLAEKARQEQAP